MLEELSVKNYALLDDISISFTEGFNVFTGETGAGKSLLVGALGLILGHRSNSSVIRKGARELQVTAVVKIADPSPALEWLREQDIEHEDNLLHLRRVVKENGRSACYIQSVSVPRSDLAELCTMLFDMHSQHENQSLFSQDNQCRILDRYGQLQNLAQEFSRNFKEFEALKIKLDEARARKTEFNEEEDYLRFALEEIAQAKIEEGEYESLKEQHDLLSKSEELFTNISSFTEKSGESLDQLEDALPELMKLSSIVKGLEDLPGRMQSSILEFEDIITTVKDFKNSYSFSPEELAQIDQRMSLLYGLMKKYGGSIESVLNFAEETRRRLDTYATINEEIELHKEQVEKLEQDLILTGKTLSSARRTVALSLASAVKEQLNGLRMDQAEFKISMKLRMNQAGQPTCNSLGFDIISFELAANKGEGLKPLRLVASGGEIARIMLAIKSVVAQGDPISCLVFDEVDTGVGGEVAVKVGEYMNQLAKHKQVLSITHLATIASCASHHIKIDKKISGERTIAMVKSIAGSARELEIARMLSGDTQSTESLSYAKILLKKYNN